MEELALGKLSVGLIFLYLDAALNIRFVHWEHLLQDVGTPILLSYDALITNADLYGPWGVIQSHRLKRSLPPAPRIACSRGPGWVTRSW